METLTISDPIDPARAQAFCAVLGLEERPVAGQPLPEFFHQIYFWQVFPPRALGRDGHPKTGDLIRDLGLPQRMWAGGRLAFHRALRAGLEAVKVTEVEKIERKTGRSGPLAFVTLRHVIRQAGAHVLSEW